jgi:predicted porin
MMKKIALSTLSLALLGAASAAHAQSSVTLYGVIDDSITYVHNASGNKNLWALGNSSGGDLAGTRWGLKGQEDLGGGLAAIFQLENGFNPQNGTLGQSGRLFGRQAFVGVTSQTYGTLTLGRQYDPVVDMVQAITADNYFGSAFATPGDVDNYDNSSRTNNAIKYVSPTYAGFQFEGLYALGGVAGSTGSGQTWSLAAAYNNGPVALAAGYFRANNTNTVGANGLRTGWSASATSDGTFDGPINSGYATAKSIGIARVAAQYTVGAFTLGASYSNAQYKSDALSTFGSTEKYNVGQGFLNYQATAALLLGVGYSYTKASGNTSATYHQASLGADYSLSKRTDVYLVGAYQHASGTVGDGSGTAAQASIGSYGYNGTSSQELVALGLRHKF